MMAAILLCGLSLFSGCHKRPKTVLSDKKATAVMADMQIAAAYINRNPGDFPTDSSRQAFREAVLMSRGVTQEQLDSTLGWYARNPKEYQKLCNAVVARLEKVQGESFPLDVAAEQTDGKNLWPYPSTALLSPLSPSDGIIFNLETEGVEAGDKLILSAKELGAAPMNAMLGVVYDDGSRHYQNRNISGSNKIEVTVQTDSTRKVNRVFGKLTVRHREELPLSLDSISLLHIPMNRDNYYQIHSQRFLDKAGEKKRKKLEEERLQKERTDSLAALGEAAAQAGVAEAGMRMAVDMNAVDPGMTPEQVRARAASHQGSNTDGGSHKPGKSMFRSSSETPPSAGSGRAIPRAASPDAGTKNRLKK